MKKLLGLVIAAVLASSISGTAMGTTIQEADLLNYLEVYFSIREQSFMDAKSGMVYNSSTCRDAMSISAKVVDHENIRVQKLRGFADDWEVRLDSARTSFGIKGVTQEGDLLFVEVYEWTFFDYISGSSLVDTAGYGVDHKLVFSKEKGVLKLLEDEYDEGPLTGMRTIEKSLSAYGKVEESEELLQQNINLVQPNNISFIYNPDQAARYAKKYVNPTAKFRANTPCFEQFYNPEYRIAGKLGPEYNQDCTNYVSQALYFGGLPMTSIWYYSDMGIKCNDPSHEATRQGGGHECTEKHVCSNAWVGVGSLMNAMVGVYGTLKENPDDSDIRVGDIVQYDFDSNTNPGWNHSTICTGQNSAGKPVVCSHNWDYYNVGWKYSDGLTKWRIIQIQTSNDDFGNSMGYAGNLFRSTGVEYVGGKIDYAGDLDYIKYTPCVSKTYTIQTKGSTDTYGQLYNSTGVLLSSDNDSGDGMNFKIRYFLTTGNTYYISVRHNNSSMTGSYSLYVHDDFYFPPDSVYNPTN